MSSTTGVTSSSGSGMGGGGGAPVMIPRLFVAGGRLNSGVPRDTLFAVTIQADGSLGAFDTSVQTMSEARELFGFAVVDSNLFVMGGLGLDPSNNAIDETSSIVGAMAPSGIVSGWSLAPANLPMGMGRMAVASLGKNVFVAGGQSSSGSTTSKLMLRADVSSGTIPSYDTIATLPLATANAGLVIVDGHIVVIGGTASNKSVLSAPIGADGTLGGPLSPSSSLLQGRTSHCALTAEIGGQSLVYVVGGEGSPPLDTIEVATSQNGVLSNWKPSSVKLPMGRHSAGCAIFGNRIYVVGGLMTTAQGVADITRIDLDPMTGLPTATHTETPLPEGRAYLGATVIELPKP